jgi:AcrR family transcriptional regulator
VPRALPRGRHRLPREIVASSQRSRLLAAVAQAVAEKGYAAVTVADLTARAGVSRTTFYDNFRDKEDCFLASYAAGADAHFERVGESGTRAAGWYAQLTASTAAYLEVLAAQPAYARAFLVEILAAGSAATRLRLDVHRRYAARLRSWHEEVRAQVCSPAVPAEAYDAAVGAVYELVANQVRRGATEDLRDLLPALVYVQLALLGLLPYAGGGAASG